MELRNYWVGRLEYADAHLWILWERTKMGGSVPRLSSG